MRGASAPGYIRNFCIIAPSIRFVGCTTRRVLLGATARRGGRSDDAVVYRGVVASGEIISVDDDVSMRGIAVAVCRLVGTGLEVREPSLRCTGSRSRFQPNEERERELVEARVAAAYPLVRDRPGRGRPTRRFSRFVGPVER